MNLFPLDERWERDNAEARATLDAVKGWGLAQFLHDMAMMSYSGKVGMPPAPLYVTQAARILADDTNRKQLLKLIEG